MNHITECSCCGSKKIFLLHDGFFTDAYECKDCYKITICNKDDPNEGYFPEKKIDVAVDDLTAKYVKLKQEYFEEHTRNNNAGITEKYLGYLHHVLSESKTVDELISKI